MTSYESVCEELDALTMTYLTTISEYNRQWQNTSELLSKGYLDLSHAKYTMGSRTISHYSYDERMKAKTIVEIDEEEDVIHVKKVTENDINKEEEEAAAAAAAENKENDINNNNSLRKRNVKKTPTKEEGEGEWISSSTEEKEKQDIKDDIELDKKQKTKKKKSDNPLHWFGLLVSPSLRTSQENFTAALPLLVEQANRIRKLEEIEKKFNELQETKLALKLKNTSLADVTVE